jgi:hypothetical protein
MSKAQGGNRRIWPDRDLLQKKNWDWQVGRAGYFFHVCCGGLVVEIYLFFLMPACRLDLTFFFFWNEAMHL